MTPNISVADKLTAQKLGDQLTDKRVYGTFEFLSNGSVADAAGALIPGSSVSIVHDVGFLLRHSDEKFFFAFAHRPVRVEPTGLVTHESECHHTLVGYSKTTQGTYKCLWAQRNDTRTHSSRSRARGHTKADGSVVHPAGLNASAVFVALPESGEGEGIDWSSPEFVRRRVS